MGSRSLEQKGIDILKKGILESDERNIAIFKKIIRDYAMVTCFAFACGVAAAFPLAKMSVVVQTEQASRTDAVYNHDNRRSSRY